jgi:hypothetical protein
MYFDAKEVPFLGFMVSGSGLRMDPDKAKAIVQSPQPTKVKKVQQLLRLWNYYRRFVPGYAAIVAPLTDLLRGKTQDINWADAQEAAFLKITIHFTSVKTPILSRCLAFTSGEGGTTAAGEQTLLRKEQWMEIGVMQLDDDDREEINIGAIAI